MLDLRRKLLQFTLLEIGYGPIGHTCFGPAKRIVALV